MSDFVPTAEQRAAIEHPRTHACVVAGAGSGKTAVLTRRFAELVLEYGLPVRRVAALTFTEKAAAEMRERIASVFEAVGREDLRAEVDFAAISTIHSFCARLLRLHAIEAGVDPSFRVLDGVEAQLLLEDAWEASLRRLDAEDAADAYVLERVRASSLDLLGFLQRVRGAGRDVAALEWASAPGDPEAAAAVVETACDDFLVAASYDASVGRRAIEAVTSVRASLVADADQPWRLTAVQTELRGVRPDRGRGPRAFTTARKVLDVAVGALLEAVLDRFGREAVAAPLRRVLAAAESVYEVRKWELGALDFTDLERLALRVLERRAAAGRGVALRPRALLVDEYQDTNPLQARILERLRGDACPLFSVGDPKQSIYRFRRADVRVIADEFARVGPEGRHLLQATFRARPSLVDCLNALHARLFDAGQAGVDHVALRADGEFRDVEGPDVEFALVDAGAAADAEERRRAEARWIAAWISDFVRSGVPRAKVERDRDGHEREGRPLGFGDVAILLRARTNLYAYEEALSDAGIPFHSYKGRGFFQADEVVDLVHVLRVVYDPADDHAFAAMATGPVLAATDGDLLDLFPDPTVSHARGGQPSGLAWQRLRSRTDRRSTFVAATIERARREGLAGRLGRVVETVLYDLGLMEAALMQPDGARRAANLRKAVGVARELERSGREDLGDLLRHLSLMRDRELREAEAALGREGEDVVLLNTVHGSKGLEYPVVVVADVGRQAPNAWESVGYDGEHGFALPLRHPLEGTSHNPGAYVSLHEAEQLLAEQESRRLLYVATTRAEERLVLTGSCAGLKANGAPNRFLEWGPWLLDAVGRAPAEESVDVTFGSGTLRTVLATAPPPPPPRAPRPPAAAPDAPTVRLASELLAAAREDVAPLGDTPYVVTVSDLLGFARSPAAYYAHRLDPRGEGGAVRHPALDADDPASRPGDEDPAAAWRAERRPLWDEPAEHRDGIDRAALGRALHALLERVPGAPGADAPAALLDSTDEDFGERAEAAAALLGAMLRRYESSPTGRRVAAALQAGADVRREMDFHARIRFPSGTRVGAFEALLVRGSIDLWLPEADGVWVVDHKTNPRSAALPDPQALGRLYAWQLRLYALAAERILGEDVAGARLLLLDPSWGEGAVEVAVDVSGPVLEDARRLCQAYAVAELEGRWPEAWQALLES